jgi:hypothetical protein
MSVILENLVTSLPLSPTQVAPWGGGEEGRKWGGRGAERVREGEGEKRGAGHLATCLTSQGDRPYM